METLDLDSPDPSVVVSLPDNDLQYAEAAVSAGADAVKVHLNAEHRASGMTFGTLEDERDTIAQIVNLGIPVGIVPGQNVKTIRNLLPELADLGVSFVDAFAHHSPPETRSITGLETWVAPTSDYEPAEIRALAQTDIDALELALFSKESYGNPLSMREASLYQQLAQELPCPVVVPTQLALTPDDAVHLARNGVPNFLLGSIVLGETPESVGELTGEFVTALESVTSES